MPSFDIVSEIDKPELANGLHQAVGGGKARQVIELKEGIDSELGRKLVKQIKDKKLKVQTAIQGDQLRVTGKKRDDLQQVIAFLRESDVGIPLQFNNFRD